MKKEYKKEFDEITRNIISNEYFQRTKDDFHHGSCKYDHLLRVAKLSFVLGKIMKADIKSVTRSAILHDFFFGSRKESIENSYLNHPSTAAKNAKEIFNINELEETAIKTHMFHHVLLKKIFPFINRKEHAKLKENKPTSKEGWIVCISDLIVSVIECQRYEFSYLANLSILVFLNIIFFKH